MTSSAEVVETRLDRSRQDVASAVIEDAREIVAFLGRHEEVSLLPWQDESHLRIVLADPGAIAFVVRCDEGKLIGSLIGGVLGTRGTINQIAVDAARRGSGIGRSLVEAFEFALRRRGVRRYFLFSTRANAATRRFWIQQGFNEMTASEVTYERDL